MSDVQSLQPRHNFLTGNTGYSKSFLMQVLYESLTKMFLSHENVSLNKPMVLFMAPAVVVATNINGLIIHTVLNIPINQFGKNYHL